MSLSVLKSISILKIYDAHKNEELWVNELVRKVHKTTGSKDYPGIKKGITFLEKGKILQSQKVNKQKTIKRLTPLGIEIINLFDNLELINKTFSNVQERIINFTTLVTKNEKTWRSKLLYYGYAKDDVESFHDIVNIFDSFVNLN